MQEFSFLPIFKIYFLLHWYVYSVSPSPCLPPFCPVDVPIVTTTLGKVQGTVGFSYWFRPYFQYLGIPYAEPPVGNGRFEAPVPFKKPWGEQVRPAREYGSDCLQFDVILLGRVMGNEDCLFLNIFAPMGNFTPPSYPVIVWIHGGAFASGGSRSYDPLYLMDTGDIVVVTINYRLGSLGFLNTGDHLVRGNMGLKDQNMALRFVRDNIARFGGDPSKVTLFGESSGAASVHYHMISPLSKGLFHRAVMQSGNVFCPWAYTRSPEKQALDFGKRVNCPTHNTSVLVSCLKRKSGREIVEQHAALLSPVHPQDEFFAPSVETVRRDDTFLADNPFMMLKRGEFSRVPAIFGVNSGEGAIKTARAMCFLLFVPGFEATPLILNTLDARWEELAPILLHYNPALKNISAALRRHYFPASLPPPVFEEIPKSGNVTGDRLPVSPLSRELQKGILTPPQRNLENVTLMISDGVWFQANEQAALHHSQFAPTYLNYFDYLSDILPSAYTCLKAATASSVPIPVYWLTCVLEALVNDMPFNPQNPKRFGACHSDDLVFYWNIVTGPPLRLQLQDYDFSRALVVTLLNFARGASTLKFQGVTWEPANNKKGKQMRYMKLDKEGRMIEPPFGSRIAFLDSLNIRDPLDTNNY